MPKWLQTSLLELRQEAPGSDFCPQVRERAVRLHRPAQPPPPSLAQVPTEPGLEPGDVRSIRHWQAGSRGCVTCWAPNTATTTPKAQ